MIRLTVILLVIFRCTMAWSQNERLPDKLSAAARMHISQNRADSFHIMLSVTKESVSRVQKKLRVEYIHHGSGTMICKTTAAMLEDLLADPGVVFADLHRKPVEEITTGAFDLSANGIIRAHGVFPDIRGDSILISIKEQRFDTDDIDLRGRYLNTGVAAAGLSTHASIMATMIAGAGNSSPFATGTAWRSDITSSDFFTLLPDPDTIYQHFGITVQNHSYGTGIENYYGPDAFAYDQNSIDNPHLLHVFSSGNEGSSAPANGIYAGISGYANLTGSFKMAKNILTAGAIDSFRNTVPFSSRGPAFDGRIKPELVAFGFDGSSGAAALVSGTAALLQQLYRELYHSLPSSSLLKCILINSADDIGASGPDFISGYGSLNATEALRTVEQGRFHQSAVNPGQPYYFPLTIPAGISHCRITLAWTDATAPVNATKALVNDLDLRLIRVSSGEIWMPWILNHYPHADSLSLPPSRGNDTLNNIEQISVDFPAPGNYQIRVNAANITSSQDFAISWCMIADSAFEWTYPVASSPLQNNRLSQLRWQTSLTGAADISLSLNNGPWEPVAALPDISSGQYAWDAGEISGTIIFRISSNSSYFLSDTISISPQPALDVGYICKDSFLLYWNEIPGDSAILYGLGSKYLEPVIYTTDTLVPLNSSNLPYEIFALASITGMHEGFRSASINYRNQAVACYFRNFMAELDNDMVNISVHLGTTHGITEIQIMKLFTSGYQPIKTITNPSMMINHTDSSLYNGLNAYMIYLKLANGKTVAAGPRNIFYMPGRPVLVYPNPAYYNQPVQIIADDIFSYTVFVYDASGKLYFSRFLENEKTLIPPYILSRGIYFIRVHDESGNAVHTSKFLVQ